jgi:hypothetical protein
MEDVLALYAPPMPGTAKNPVARTTTAASKGMEPEDEPRRRYHQLAVDAQKGTPVSEDPVKETFWKSGWDVIQGPRSSPPLITFKTPGGRMLSDTGFIPRRIWQFHLK